MNIDEKKAVISNALVERKGIQYIVDKASEVFHNPIFIIDLSMKVIAHSGLPIHDNGIWDEMYRSQMASFDIAKVVEDAGVYQHLMHSDEPIYGKFDFYPKRFLGSRIRDKVNALAFIAIIEENPIQKDEEVLIVFLCKILFYEMLYTDRTAMQQIPAYSIVKDVLENLSDEETVARRLNYLNIHLPKYMQLFVIEYDPNKIGLTLYYLQKMISSTFPDDICIIYQERILLVSSHHGVGNTLKRLRTLISGIPAKIGISRTFTQFASLPQAYRDSLQAITLGRQISPEAFSYSYDSVVLEDLIYTMNQSMDIRPFVSPILCQLEEYDEQNNAQLKSTLDIYLQTGRSIQRTTEKMHIHRSTLYSRLEKIQDLVNINFEDDEFCFYLQLSYYIDTLLGKIHHTPDKMFGN